MRQVLSEGLPQEFCYKSNTARNLRVKDLKHHLLRAVRCWYREFLAEVRSNVKDPMDIMGAAWEDQDYFGLRLLVEKAGGDGEAARVIGALIEVWLRCIGSCERLGAVNQRALSFLAAPTLFHQASVLSNHDMGHPVLKTLLFMFRLSTALLWRAVLSCSCRTASA